MVVAPTKATNLKTYLCPATALSDDSVQKDVEALLAESRQEFGTEQANIRETSLLTLRFTGQNHALDIPYNGNLSTAIELFKDLYQERYGVLPQKSIEAVHVSIQRQGKTGELPPAVDSSSTETEGYKLERDTLPVDIHIDGPRIVTDSYATTFVKPGWRFYRDKYGHLILSKTNT